MSSNVLTVTTVLAEELEDPGVVQEISKHMADGCPLAPLVEAVTPGYRKAERPRLIAAMVERARALIVEHNEHHADDEPNCSADEKESPKRGRPRSEKRAAIKAVAKAKGVSESTVRRDLAEVDPPAPRPAKPVPVERLITEYAAKLEALAHEGAQLLEFALADANDPSGSWRGSLRTVITEIDRKPARLRDLADEIKRSRGRLARTDWEAGKRGQEAKGKISSAQAARERREAKHRWSQDAEENRERALAAAEGPKVGLGGRQLDVEMVDADGNSTRFVPEQEQVVRAFQEADGIFGPDGETGDEGAF